MYFNSFIFVNRLDTVAIVVRYPPPILSESLFVSEFGLANRHEFLIRCSKTTMNNLLRGLIAGYGAKKLGGGCFGTVIVFILIWVALGQCS